jgi:hypothetical protein
MSLVRRIMSLTPTASQIRCVHNVAKKAANTGVNSTNPEVVKAYDMGFAKGLEARSVMMVGSLFSKQLAEVKKKAHEKGFIEGKEEGKEIGYLNGLLAGAKHRFP